MDLTAIKKRRWEITCDKEINIIEEKNVTHFIIGDFEKFKVGSDLRTLISNASCSSYGYVAFSLTDRGDLYITTDIVGSIPVYLSNKGKLVTTNYPLALKFGSPKILKNAYVYDIERNSAYKYYNFNVGNMKIFESDIEKELKSYLYREIGGKEVALAFSGGLDSSILAKIASEMAHVELFTLGLEGSYDITMAELVAEKLHLPLVSVVVSEEEIEKAIDVVIRSAPVSSSMDLSLAVGFFLLGKKIKSSGFKSVILGQLADELFAGYKKYESVPVKILNNVLLEDVKKAYLGLARDVSSFLISGVRVIAPYAKKRIVNLGLKTSPTLKIKDGKRKYILRRLAKKLGLPKFVIEGPKKAFQYGSGIDKLVKRLMKNRSEFSEPYYF